MCKFTFKNLIQLNPKMTLANSSDEHLTSGEKSTLSNNSTKKDTKKESKGDGAKIKGFNKPTKLNEEKFLVILDNLVPSQDSINTVSKWIIDHSMNHELICKLWFKKLNDSNIENSQ